MKIHSLAFKIWLTILPVAFLNGMFRVFLINPAIGEKFGHIISTLLLSIAVVLVIYFFIKKVKIEKNKDLLFIGLLLVIMTMVFEFGLGLATGKSWEFMLADYNLFQGKVWSLVLLTEFLSPLIIKKCV